MIKIIPIIIHIINKKYFDIKLIKKRHKRGYQPPYIIYLASLVLGLYDSVKGISTITASTGSFPFSQYFFGR